MGVAEDIEVFFSVGVAVAGVVGVDGFAFEGVAGGLVEAGTRVSERVWPLVV